MIEQYVLYIISFSIFVVLQSLAINGVYYAFDGGCTNDLVKGKICNGNILYKIWPSFFERNKNRYWSKPFFSCIKCMSSIWGAITFWPVVIYLFGFNKMEIFAYGFDVCALVPINWYIFKKI